MQRLLCKVGGVEALGQEACDAAESFSDGAYRPSSNVILAWRSRVDSQLKTSQNRENSPDFTQLCL